MRWPASSAALRDKGARSDGDSRGYPPRRQILRQLRKEERSHCWRKTTRQGKRCSPAGPLGPASRAACTRRRGLRHTPPRSFSTRSTVATPTPTVWPASPVNVFHRPLFAMEPPKRRWAARQTGIMVAASPRHSGEKRSATFCPQKRWFYRSGLCRHPARHEGSALTTALDGLPSAGRPLAAPGGDRGARRSIATPSTRC